VWRTDIYVDQGLHIALRPRAGAANKVFDGITNASVWAMEGLLTMVRP
jgi:hypothetical protein